MVFVARERVWQRGRQTDCQAEKQKSRKAEKQKSRKDSFEKSGTELKIDMKSEF